MNRKWLWVYYNKILIYPIFYLLKGDYRVQRGLGFNRDVLGVAWGYKGVYGGYIGICRSIYGGLWGCFGLYATFWSSG